MAALPSPWSPIVRLAVGPRSSGNGIALYGRLRGVLESSGHEAVGFTPEHRTFEAITSTVGGIADGVDGSRSRHLRASRGPVSYRENESHTLVIRTDSANIDCISMLLVERRMLAGQLRRFAKRLSKL